MYTAAAGYLTHLQLDAYVAISLYNLGQDIQPEQNFTSTDNISFEFQ